MAPKKQHSPQPSNARRKVSAKAGDAAQLTMNKQTEAPSVGQPKQLHPTHGAPKPSPPQLLRQAATPSTATAKKRKSRNTPPMLTLRHLHDALCLAASSTVKQAADLLGVVEPATSMAPSSVAGTPRQHTVESSRRSGSTPASLAPSVALVLAAVTRLSLLVAGMQSHSSIDGAPAAEVMLLSRVITLYCLETAAEDLQGHHTSSMSGQTTPAGGSATPRIRGRRGGGGVTPSALSGGGGAGGVTDWLGSRLTTSSAVLPDSQLAEQLLRPAVEVTAKVSALQAVVPVGDSTSFVRETCSGTKAAADDAALLDDLRASAMALLCAVLSRFPNADFHSATLLPMLFPEVDARTGPQAQHPILTPLLWSSVSSVRGTAALLLATVLNRLQATLQYAEESKPGRQSFVSLSTQGGLALKAVHQSLHWALGGGADDRDAQPPPPPVLLQGSKTPVLHAYGALVVTTPYNRCPQSLALVLSSLQLPVVRQLLQGDASPEYGAATGFLGAVFQNGSLRSHVSQLLCAAAEKRGRRSGGSQDDTILVALLTHARERVEVWRCLVQVARLFPSLIQEHFGFLLKTSEDAVHTLVRQEKRTHTFRDPNDSNTPVPQLPSASEPTDASPGAFAECLRAWLHFMGYVWKAFDNNPEDPALLAENQCDRATLAQKQEIVRRIIVPSMRLESHEEVRVMTLRCLAQVSEEFMASASLQTSERERMVRYAVTAVADWSAQVRSEALTTLGMWAWQYPSLDRHNPECVRCAEEALTREPDLTVRAKAAFALSNLSSRLQEPTSTVRGSVEHMDCLTNAAMLAVNDVSPIVQGHGIRMINHLLQVLSYEELIGELLPVYGPPEEEECVAEGFLRVLLQYMKTTFRDAKLRWNAACALGMGLRRDVVFESEPRYALEAVGCLMQAVVRDRIFKVRSQAAIALSKVSRIGLSGKYGTESLEPAVLRALCTALGSSRSTENFAQYREQGALRDAVRSAIGTFITTASPSAELDKVLSEYRHVLTSEGLL